MFAPICVGIDLAKAHLDVHLLPDDKRQRFCNTPGGQRKLLKFVAPFKADRIILEATGLRRAQSSRGYETALLFRMIDKKLPAVVLNPFEVRSFARSRRIHAKNDQMDAKILAEFGQANPTRIVDQSVKMLHVLKQLVSLRRQMVCQRARLRNQLEHVDVAMVAKVIRRNIRNLDQEIKDVQKLIQEQIDANEALAQKQKKLQQAPGVAATVSAILVTELPELGTLHRRKIAALVGVAPFDNASGKGDHPRHIKGGRATVRSALYMATLVGIRHDPILKAHYQNLIARGKPKKVALVACMNKRLNYLNSLVRESTPPGAGAK